MSDPISESDEQGCAPLTSASPRPLAVVTGASSGMGYELARLCAEQGFDLLIAADQPDIAEAAQAFRQAGVQVSALQLDLATGTGVAKLYRKVREMGRPVDYLLADAGRGLGRGFLDQDFGEVQKVIDTNITGALDLIQKIGRDMRESGRGRILITGSFAGLVPGAFQAAYDGSRAFLGSFGLALRNELKDTGVSVTCLTPGATDTGVFEHADMQDSRVGQARKDDPADAARTGFDAMMRGEGDVAAGSKTKVAAALAAVTPRSALAEQQRKMAEPGGGQAG